MGSQPTDAGWVQSRPNLRARATPATRSKPWPRRDS